MSKTDLASLKAAHPILEVLRDLGLEAHNHRFRCPRPENHVHGDRTPSVSVWPERGQFKCWVCPDVKGDVIDLVRLVKGCGFREAVAFLGGARADAASAPRSARPDAAGVPSRPATGASGQVAGDSEAATAAAATSAAATAGAEELKLKILAAFLDMCPPVGGKAARYLQRRRIFRRTWDAQGLRMVDDYGSLSDGLAAAFGLPALEAAGFFNPAGHLRYYRHRLLFPYFNREGRPVYMQVRALEEEVKPKELSLPGPIPLPYHARLLDGEPGQIYLCEGVIDTLTLLEQGFPAVGIPGAANFKPAWAALFRGKTVHVAFDPDAAGDTGAAKAMDLLRAAGVEARRLAPPRGMDLNDWFRRG